jgi:uncharacterized protein YecE (DUF72 family)
MKPVSIHIGCAGWTIPKAYNEYFPATGSHLERYASRFNAVEINSSFYRSHKPSTYQGWAGSVPGYFRFAVKVPKQITHVSRLQDINLIKGFLEEVSGLGDKLGPLLVQLPPSLSSDEEIARTFFAEFRNRFKGNAVCEPRHKSWFTAQADELLTRFRVARVAADPAPVPNGDKPGGWNGLAYFRLHGSPKKYYSSYTYEQLKSIAKSVKEATNSAETWCIFDNTAAGAAIPNSLELLELLMDKR